MVKVIDIDIVSGTQGVEERRGLAAENSDHPLCIEQVENGITEFRAGAFKVAEFVDDGESGGSRSPVLWKQDRRRENR